MKIIHIMNNKDTKITIFRQYKLCFIDADDVRLYNLYNISLRYVPFLLHYSNL